MDVEALINELQSRSKSRNAFPSSNLPGPSLQPPPYQQYQGTRQLTSSLSSNITIIDANPLDEDSRSEASSVRLSQMSDDHDLLSSHILDSPLSTDGVQSWVKTEPISRNDHSPAPSMSASSSIAEENRYTDGRLDAGDVDNEPLVRI